MNLAQVKTNIVVVHFNVSRNYRSEVNLAQAGRRCPVRGALMGAAIIGAR